MSAVLKYVFFAVILYTGAEAYVGIIREAPKPAKFADQEGCYFEKFDRLLEIGVPFSPRDGTTCENYICKDSKEIFIEGCSTRGIADYCEKIPADLSQAYPDCCEKVRCTLPNGEEVEV